MASETPVDSAEAETTPEKLTFADLGLDAAVLKALKDVGYETPSAIQAATIPVLLQGRDVVGLAQTGTGKTAAFALPVLSQMETGHKNPQALVLAPTRELALQVCEAFEKYAAHIKGVSVLPVYGGQGYGQQLSALRRGVDVIVGTPGRIMDHLDKGTLDLSELKFLVLDEADEMLKMGFAEDVETILADTPSTKQVALFSATMPAQIRRISAQYLNDPEEITVKTKTTTSANITQRYLIVSYQQKIDALTRILEVENFEGMIVFTRTKNETETVAEKAARPRLHRGGDQRRHRPGAARAHGQPAQVGQARHPRGDRRRRARPRRRAHQPRRQLRPADRHRVVRAPHRPHRRAGRTGDAISFVTPRERRMLTAIEKATRQPLTEMSLPSVDDVNATRLTRFDDAITAALEDTAAIATFRDVVAHYVEHHDVPEADVAAASPWSPRATPRCCSRRRPFASSASTTTVRRATADPETPVRATVVRAATAPGASRRIASPSVVVSASNPARSSAPWRTRAVCVATTSVRSRSVRTSRSSSSPPTSRATRSTASPTRGSRGSSSTCASTRAADPPSAATGPAPRPRPRLSRHPAAAPGSRHPFDAPVPLEGAGRRRFPAGNEAGGRGLGRVPAYGARIFRPERRVRPKRRGVAGVRPAVAGIPASGS